MSASLFRSQVRQVVNGIELTGFDLRWFDDVVYERSNAEKNSRTNNSYVEDHDIQDRIDVLTHVLYNHFYTTSRPMLKLEVALQNQYATRGSIASGLMAANPGTGRWDSDWCCRTVLRDGEGFTVQKGGLTLLATAGEVRTRDGAQPAAGDAVSVRTPAGSLSRSPGFYVAHSDYPMDYQQPLSRIYMNVTASGAPALLGDLVGALNIRGFAFDFKVANDIAHYHRCDVAVLYIPRARFVDVFKELGPVFGLHRHSIRPVVSPFVCQLLPGVGGADDPSNGESFGSDRCRRLAVAVVEAANIPAGDERLNVVVDLVERSGLDPERPYLSSTSDTDVYCALT